MVGEVVGWPRVLETQPRRSCYDHHRVGAQIMEPIADKDYTLVYFHTNLTHKPDFSWMRKTYKVLPEKYAAPLPSPVPVPIALSLRDRGKRETVPRLTWLLTCTAFHMGLQHATTETPPKTEIVHANGLCLYLGGDGSMKCGVCDGISPGTWWTKSGEASTGPFLWEVTPGPRTGLVRGHSS